MEYADKVPYFGKKQSDFGSSLFEKKWLQLSTT
jgi:hypothetical protein